VKGQNGRRQSPPIKKVSVRREKDRNAIGAFSHGKIKRSKNGVGGVSRETRTGKKS